MDISKLPSLKNEGRFWKYYRSTSEQASQLGSLHFSMVLPVWFSVLRYRDDGYGSLPPRLGADWYDAPFFSTASRCNDCRRYSHHEDVAPSKATLRADGRSQVCHRHGKLRHQRRSLLAARLSCSKRCGYSYSRRCLYSWVSTTT